jgi:hypothetical protein
MVNHPQSGYTRTMRFRLGLVTGLATGYYLGARAGRQRYDQINRSLARLRRSEAFEVATERAKAVVEESVEKAREVIEHRTDERTDEGGEGGQTSATNGHGADEAQPTAGIILPTDPPTGLGGYSSSR